MLYITKDIIRTIKSIKRQYKRGDYNNLFEVFRFFVYVMKHKFKFIYFVKYEFDEEEYARQYPPCRITDEEREEFLRKLMGGE